MHKTAEYSKWNFNKSFIAKIFLNKRNMVMFYLVSLTIIFGIFTSIPTQAFAQKTQPSYPTDTNAVVLQDIINRIEAMRVELVNLINDARTQILSAIASARTVILAAIADVKVDTVAINYTLSGGPDKLSHLHEQIDLIEADTSFINYTLIEGPDNLPHIHDRIDSLRDKVNDEHKDREDEHEAILGSITSLQDSNSGTGIVAYKVRIDMRFNQYDGVDAGIIASLHNIFGIKAICPQDDPHCGLATFTYAKNVPGYTYCDVETRNGDDKSAACDVNVAFVNGGRALPVMYTDGVEFARLYWQTIVGNQVPALVGMNQNLLYDMGTGPVYGKQLTFMASPIPYTGVMEFMVYATEGTTFKTVSGCDNFDDSHPVEVLAATFLAHRYCDWEERDVLLVEEYNP